MSLASAVRTRFVAAEPPHEPEPFPDEPFAPVYDFIPLGPGGELPAWTPSPRHPDAITFGPPGADPFRPVQEVRPYRSCGLCDVGWNGDAARCRNCGI